MQCWMKMWVSILGEGAGVCLCVREGCPCHVRACGGRSSLPTRTARDVGHFLEGRAGPKLPSLVLQNVCELPNSLD